MQEQYPNEQHVYESCSGLIWRTIPICLRDWVRLNQEVPCQIRTDNLSKYKQWWLLDQDIFNKGFISLAFID
jgi:hypothetical protein